MSRGRVLQNRAAPDPRTFIGEGKVREMKSVIDSEKCTLAVFDNELSPSQMRALSDDLGVKVLDRSSLILDIFAQRARTKRGAASGGACPVQISSASAYRHVGPSCAADIFLKSYRYKGTRRDTA